MKNRVMSLTKRCRDISVGLVFLTALQPCVPPLLQAQTLTPRERFQEAREKYLANDNRGAIEKCQAALAIDPSYWWADQLAGYASFKMGDMANAEKYCLESLRIHPDNPTLLTFVDKHFPGKLTSAADEIPDPSTVQESSESGPLPEGLRNPAQARESEDSLGRREAGRDLLDLDTTADSLGGWMLPSAMGIFSGVMMGKVTQDPAAGMAAGLFAMLGGDVLVCNTAGEPQPDNNKIAGRSAEFQKAYQEEYRKSGKNKKHHAALGGVIGTTICVGMLGLSAMAVVESIKNINWGFGGLTW